MKNLLETIAQTADARTRCDAEGNSDWEQRHEATLCELERKLPSGSGFDAGTQIDREKSGLDRVVLLTSFHHMNELGMYDGWTEHVVTLRPTFCGLDVRVSGRDRSNIKDYIGEVFAGLNEVEL